MTKYKEFMTLYTLQCMAYEYISIQYMNGKTTAVLYLFRLREYLHVYLR